MSVVVAIKDGDNVYIGADSQVTRGGSRVSLSNPNNYKIWKVKGVENCIMGHVGLVRDACAIRVLDDIVREIDILKDRVNYEYIVNNVMPKIIDELKNRSYIKDEGVFEGLESKFIFAYKDKLYIIGNDASVLEFDDYCAIGSGESEAIGSLTTTLKDENPKERIVKAIKASAIHGIYVDYPIVITDTQNTKFEIISE